MKVVFDPNKKEAKDGEILIGLGNCNKCINKNQKYPSCAIFLFHSDIQYNNEIIYIEDYSPDTIITIYLLLNKRLPYKYIEYATKWEEGRDDPDVYKSYGVLQYSLLQTIAEKSPEEKVHISLKFLDILIKQNISLDNIPKLNDLMYKQAYELMEKEIKAFKKLVSSSEKYYLEINGQIVKSIFVYNSYITPLVKLLLRKKFNFIASFNEDLVGTGNDVVISVIPDSGLSLEKLWYELEKKETDYWKGKRPNDTPRIIVSTDKWNEPWWDDMGKFTIIAAPKKMKDYLGSKIPYDEIKNIIIKTYKGVKIE